MAESIKDRMYNYEEMPPQGVWEEIAAMLDGEQAVVVPIQKKRNRILTYSLAAAAGVVLILFGFFLFRDDDAETATNLTAINTRQSTSEDIALQKQLDEPDPATVIITVPLKNKAAEKEDFAVKKAEKGPSQKEEVSDSSKSEVVKVEVDESKERDKPAYITITNPEGQEVKVSSKVASLMESSEDPAKPVWNKKVKEWKSLMQNNTLAPTPGNFMDIIELTKSLKDK